MSKPQLRVVLDTNIYIAAVLSPNGSSARVWELARQRRFQIIISPFIVNEMGRVLRRLGREEQDIINQAIQGNYPHRRNRPADNIPASRS